MAVFMINICKYNGCGITFPSLGDLIQHIEATHIDYDPIVVEQKEASQPSCIPLSYVLRFFTEASRREIQTTPAPEIRRRVMSAPKTPSVRSSTPTGSEFDEEELVSHSEDSNDSWTTIEEYSSEFILRYGSRLNTSASAAPGAPSVDKPFACPVPGCKKRYKNVNGIKYHSKNGHKKDGKVKKGYKCHCGKSYKTAQGLKNHSVSQHISTNASLAQAPSVVATDYCTKPLMTPFSKAIHGLVVTSAQQLGRSFNIIESLESNNLVRIYDNTKIKDNIASFIPKHTLSNLSIVNKGVDLSNQSVTSHIISSGNSHGLLNLTANNTSVEKLKHDRTPKITAHSQLPLNEVQKASFTNETFVPKVALK